MNKQDLTRILSKLSRSLSLSYLEQTGSTSDDVKKAARAGAPDFTVEIAEKQTVGRGREGRSFFSEGGLYMSLLLPATDALPYLTHLAAVAVAKAITALTGAEARVKWVNDVYVDGKKVCGILTESITVNGVRRIVVGMGVNVEDRLPDELRDVAAAVPCDKSDLAAAILSCFFERFDAFSADLLKKEYRELCFLVGERVLVIKEKGSREAAVLGLTDDLGLDVLYDDGTRESLISGEVRLKPLIGISR